ncbi:hypothetical protein [Actinomadura napierensis]|uniref:Uncharacterized protein n=1 Tax=Actinomadura napierensis TaxID=267854 RepID=A0ABP5JKE8_9ACTN
MSTSDDEQRSLGPAQSVSNEFAFITFTRVLTGNGERLLLESPKRRRRVLLDPVVLDALTCFTPEELSRLVASLDEERSGDDQPISTERER